MHLSPHSLLFSREGRGRLKGQGRNRGVRCWTEGRSGTVGGRGEGGGGQGREGTMREVGGGVGGGRAPEAQLRRPAGALAPPPPPRTTACACRGSRTILRSTLPAPPHRPSGASEMTEVTQIDWGKLERRGRKSVRGSSAEGRPRSCHAAEAGPDCGLHPRLAPGKRCSTTVDSS